MEYEEPEDDIKNMIMNSNIDDFIRTEEEDKQTVEYRSITIIDALEMANDAWSNGAPFDVDYRVLKDLIESDPVRIVDMQEVVINNHKMYCVWGIVSVKSVDYDVPIRFYADKEELDSKTFSWSIDRDINHICLQAIIELLKYKETKRWSELLDS